MWRIDSLLRAKRRRLHARIAMILEERFAQVVKQRPELLARHFAAAGLSLESHRLLASGGGSSPGAFRQRRGGRPSPSGDRTGFGSAGGEHRQRLETDLQLALGGAAIDAKGPASPDVEAAYRRSRHLAREVGDGRCEFTALWGLWRVQFARADAHKAGELADGLMRLAERQHDPELLLEGLHAGWGTAWYRGDLVVARRHAERGRMLYDQHQHGRLGFLYGGHDPGACCLSTGGIVLWALGYADQAREWNRQTYALAEQLGVTHTLAHTWCWATILRQLLDDASSVLRRARDLHAIATEHGLANYLGQADVYLGWVLARGAPAPKASTGCDEGWCCWRVQPEAPNITYPTSGRFLPMATPAPVG